MARTAIVTALTLVLSTGFASDASANFITTPGELKAGDQFIVVFVTSKTTEAASSDIADYDAFVTDAATNAGLTTYNGSSVTWKALVSTSTVSAISRLTTDFPALYLRDGTEVASSGTDLWSGSLLHGINQDENGNTVPQVGYVWTGTNSSGSQAGDSGVYALGNTTAALGYTYFTNAGWVDYGQTSATGDAPIYAFSSVLTVPAEAIPTPEPQSYLLALVGIALVVGVRLAQWRYLARLGPVVGK